MRAVIFDMDGTLIDSEPMWKEAEKRVFSSVGVDVSASLSAQTESMTTREVSEFWHRHFPWSGKSLEQVEGEVVDHVAALISEFGEPMAGVKDVIQFFHKKKFKIGLSTNAPYRLIPVVLNKLGISDYFHAISSSQFEVQGKPHPAVYLSTIRKLQVAAEKCIAFEDSVSGIKAAKRANMKAVAIPPVSTFADDKFGIAHLTLKCLSDFNEDSLHYLSHSVPHNLPAG